MVLYNQTETTNWTSSNQSDQIYYGSFEIDMGDRMRRLLTQPHQIVAMTLGIVGIILNILSILAILRTRRVLTSHYRFIVSLAAGDVLVGSTVMAYYLGQVVNPQYPIGYGPWQARIVSRCIFMTVKSLNTTSLIISLLNLMAMAIDHFLAIMRPLHYPTLMNRRRATILIIGFWIVSLICGFSDFLSGFPRYHRNKHLYNYCEFIYLTKYQEEYPLFAIALVCLLVMCVTYIRMFCTIRARPNMRGPMKQDISRNKKALFTTLLILGTFILCWLPMCLYQVILIIQVKIDPASLERMTWLLTTIDNYLYDILLLNTILDPVIYAVRMREVQFGYRKLFSPCFRHIRKDCRYSLDTTRTSLVLDERGRHGHSQLKKKHSMESYA